MKKTITMIAIGLAGVFGLTANAQQTCGNHENCPHEKSQAGDNNKMRQPREFTEFAFEGILLDINQQTRIDSLNAAVKANMPACQKAAKGECKKAEGCDKAKGECKKAEGCDKAKDECKKAEGCDKANGECKKAEGCDKAKGECKKAEGCDKANGECKHCKEGHGQKKAPKGMKGGAANPYGTEYVEKVKEILTPEQYTIFLENIVEMAPGKGAPRHNHKVNAECAKDVKGECQQSDGQCQQQSKLKKIDKAPAGAKPGKSGKPGKPGKTDKSGKPGKPDKKAK